MDAIKNTFRRRLKAKFSNEEEKNSTMVKNICPAMASIGKSLQVQQFRNQEHMLKQTEMCMIKHKGNLNA